MAAGVTPPLGVLLAVGHRGAKVLHEKNQIERIGWTGLELREMNVELPRLPGLRVNEQPLNADDIGGLDYTRQGIDHESPPESEPLRRPIHAQSSEQGDRDRIAAGTPAQTLGGIGGLDRSGGQRVVPDHIVRANSRDYVYPTCAGGLRLAGEAT